VPIFLSVSSRHEPFTPLRIAKLIDLRASGDHSLELPSDGLKNGFYTYRLTAKDAVLVKNLIVSNE
jgi:hypothetical protein